MADNPTESTGFTPTHPAFTHTFGISTPLNAEDAFAPTQDRSHFFAGSAANAVLAQLEQGLVHALPVIVITGEASVGKTSVLREACARWGARVRAEWLGLDGIAHDAFLPAITLAFGGHAGDDGSRTERVAELVRTLASVADNEKIPVLVLDDAHTLSSEMLAELARIVSAVTATKSALRVIVLGQLELDKRLDGSALQALTDVVSVRARMVPLPVTDVRPYLNHRLAASGGDGERAFSRRSARELHTVSDGVPGNIDLIATESIRIARGMGAAQVAPEHVRTAIAAMKWPRTTAAPAATKAATATPRTERVAAPTTHKKRAATRATPAASHAATPPVAPTAANTPAPAPAPAPAPTPTPTRTTDAPSSPVAATPSAAAPPAAGEPARASETPTQPESPSLDSGHPRVKEWVSRFTDGEGVLRFGARMKLPPLTEPDALPVFDDTPPVSAIATRRMEHTLRLAPKTGEGKPAAPAPRAPAAVTTPAAAAAKPPALPVAIAPPAPEPAPIALVPQPEIVIIPEPIVLDPALLEPAPLALEIAEPAPLAPTLSAPSLTTPAPAPVHVHPPLSVPADTSAEPSSSRSSKKRKRERERAARQAHQAGSSHTGSARTSALPAAPVSAEARTAGKHNRLPGHSVLAGTPTLPAAGSPPPASRNDGPRSPRHTSPFIQAAVPLVLMVGVAAVAIFASTRTGFDQNRARTRVTATTPALPDSVPITPAPPPAKTQPVVDAAPGKFCLAVGTYLFSDRAHAKAKQLARRTKMKTWVESTTSGGTRSYRIMLGGYATESEAEHAADRLLGRGLVGEALVELIKPKRRGR